jgi:hypothetical protein
VYRAGGGNGHGRQADHEKWIKPAAVCRISRVGESGRMARMPTPPQSTKTSLAQRLTSHARTAWPQLAGVHVRHRGAFAYVDGELPDGEVIKLMRLRYGGSASMWGFALYLASTDKYEDAILPTGGFAGSPEDALDCACGLYLATPDI